MMAYRSSVHESTGFSPYRLMFGEECTLPMDVGLPRREQDLPDPIKNLYALNGLCGVCSLWGIGLCAITHRLRSANWTRPGLDPI